MTVRSRLHTYLAAALLAAYSLLVVAPTPARGDDYVDKVNALLGSVADDKRSDKVILPLCIKMTDAPAGFTDPLRAFLIPASSPLFAPAAEWAKAEPQQAAIEGLKKVTKDEDFKKAFVFAQPYGVEGNVDTAMVTANMYTDLGEQGTLSQAEHRYMPALERLQVLWHVEATRLASEGKPGDALDVLMAGMFFARQMADRPFLKEKEWGMHAIFLCLNRLRDVVYVDSRLKTPVLNGDKIRDINKRLKIRDSILGIDRIRLPEAEKIASEQLLYRIYKPGSGPDEANFATILAKLSRKDRPLRLFAEAARWDLLRAQQGTQKEAQDQINLIFGDWNKRWSLGWHDPIQKAAGDFFRLDKVKFASLDTLVGDVGTLFPMRQMLLVEEVGTRAALGVQGFWYDQRDFPRDLTAIRPRFVERAETDPFTPPKTPRQIEYFVPGKVAGVAEERHEIQVFPVVRGKPLASFAVLLDSTNFVVYSVGPDGDRSLCRRATQMVDDGRGDYLIWPPLPSLYRQQQRDVGELK